jgi:hypothetical protein
MTTLKTLTVFLSTKRSIPASGWLYSTHRSARPGRGFQRVFFVGRWLPLINDEGCPVSECVV